MHSSEKLTSAFHGIETATIGHFRSVGFMRPEIQGVVAGAHVCGPALTVSVPGDDGAALVHAVSQAQAGQVIVIDRCGDQRHACWGAVITAAAQAKGVVAAIIDGYFTDLDAITGAQFPVWARGRSPVTTKIRGSGRVGGTISCGGVTVAAGDVVLADVNGVVVLPPADALSIAAQARALQEAEVSVLARLQAGESLADITNPPALSASS